MLVFGDISPIGSALLLGLCGGDVDLADATAEAAFRGGAIRDCAARANMARSTFGRHVNDVKARMGRLIETKTYNASDLVEQDEAA